MRYLALLAVACCAPRPLVLVSSVEDSIYDAFTSLRSELHALAGFEVAALVPEDGFAIEQNLLFDGRDGLFGLCLIRQRRIIIAPANVWIRLDARNAFRITERSAKYILAHELGHAMGLAHAPTGIMTATGEDADCVGNEALCLHDDLVIAGLSP